MASLAREIESQSQLSIRETRNTYWLPGRTANPRHEQRRLDAWFESDLPQVLAGQLGAVLNPSHPGILCIRSLDIELTASLKAAKDVLIHAIASRIALQILRCIRQYKQEQTSSLTTASSVALYFPSRSAFLAEYLHSFVQNIDLDQWFFQSLNVHRFSSDSAGLLEVLLAHTPAVVHKTFRHLRPGYQERLILRLEARQCRILSLFLAKAVSTGEERLASSTVQNPTFTRIRKCILCGQDIETEEWRWVLNLQLSMPAAEPCSERTIAVLRSVLRLIGYFRSSPTHLYQKSLLSLRHRDQGALIQLLGATDGEILWSLKDHTLDDLREIVEGGPILPSAPSVNLGRGAVAHSMTTPFGGAFLLLPYLKNVPLENWVSQFTGEHAPAIASKVRLEMLSSCFGPRYRSLAASDPLLQQLCGSHSGTNEIPSSALEAIVVQLPTVFETTETTVEVCCDEQDCFVLGETQHGHWIRILSQASAADPAELPTTLRHSKSDLSYLNSRPFSSWTRLDLVSLLGAHYLLKEFSRRLPGFAYSSLPYIVANLLQTPATLKTDTESSICLLERPPLYTLLSITGMDRQTLSVPWLADDSDIQSSITVRLS